MDYKEKATILRVCSSKKGERCSRCPAFGQGSRVCMRNAMKDGAQAITDLLARAEAAEARVKDLEAILGCVDGLKPYYPSGTTFCVRTLEDDRERYYTAQSKTAMAAIEVATNLERQRDAAINELDGVSAMVDDLADFVDSEIHPVIDYNLYLSLRENVDAISMFQHESEWRGKKGE